MQGPIEQSAPLQSQGGHDDQNKQDIEAELIWSSQAQIPGEVLAAWLPR